jgi:plastocyanin domain-containing protein
MKRSLGMKILGMYFSVMVLVCGFTGVIPAAGEKPKEEKLFTAAVSKDGVQRVEIVGGDYFFNPNHIVVKVNVPVELKIRKEGVIVPHDIVMKAAEAGIDFKVSLSKEPHVVRFTPTKTGSYPFYCSKKLLFFESHREKGMEGILEVVE